LERLSLYTIAMLVGLGLIVISLVSCEVQPPLINVTHHLWILETSMWERVKNCLLLLKILVEGP
jgi:hypothetical protein